MAGTDFTEEMDCGSFFDQFDDLIEFPNDDKCKDFSSIWSMETLSGAGPIFSINNSTTVPDLSAELAVPVPYEDVMPLEWLSNFMEDSFSDGGMTLEQQDSAVKKEPSHSEFKTSSPVSVLESSSSSSSSSSGEKTVLPVGSAQLGLQRARSKRPRPATFNPRPAIQLISPTSSESENFIESDPMNHIPKAAVAEHKKKKKAKPSLLPVGPPVETDPTHPPSQSVRKCMHCQITKTPQWRAGPMGPKSLCNACGVRYKSGRLFPEYRPAASPTFVPSLHSNSHKKVIEMRSKVGEKSSAVMDATSLEPELIPNSCP